MFGELQRSFLKKILTYKKYLCFQTIEKYLVIFVLIIIIIKSLFRINIKNIFGSNSRQAHLRNSNSENNSLFKEVLL